MKFFIGSLAIVAATITLVSCKKEENPVCEAGAGGNVEIVTFAIHNGDTLINTAQHPDTAFILYGNKTSPGMDPEAYNKYFVSHAGEDHIHLTNLKCGSYYIYRTAFDSVSQTRYTGGIGIEVTQGSGEVLVGIGVK